MNIIIIVAMTADRVIGKDGKLPWHVPEDLKFFKRTTQGHAIVMGRKTFESMGRPLPARRNIVVTRQAEFSLEPTNQAQVRIAHSLNEAIHNETLDPFESKRQLFIIGGGEIFAEAINIADEMFITHINQAVDGDTLFPAYNTNDWIDCGLVDPGFELAHRYIRK